MPVFAPQPRAIHTPSLLLRAVPYRLRWPPTECAAPAFFCLVFRLSVDGMSYSSQHSLRSRRKGSARRGSEVEVHSLVIPRAIFCSPTSFRTALKYLLLLTRCLLLST